MPTTPDQRKLWHTATTAPTEDNHHAPKPPSCRVPSTTFKKECDNVDAAVRMNPRISPGTRRAEGERVTRRPSRRMVAPAGVTALVPARPDMDFSRPLAPTTQDQPSAPPHPPPTNMRQQSRGHRRRLTTANEARPAGSKQDTRRQGPAAPQPRGREQPPPA